MSPSHINTLLHTVDQLKEIITHSHGSETSAHLGRVESLIKKIDEKTKHVGAKSAESSPIVVVAPVTIPSVS